MSRVGPVQVPLGPVYGPVGHTGLTQEFQVGPVWVPLGFRSCASGSRWESNTCPCCSRRRRLLYSCSLRYVSSLSLTVLLIQFSHRDCSSSSRCGWWVPLGPVYGSSAGLSVCPRYFMRPVVCSTPGLSVSSLPTTPALITNTNSSRSLTMTCSLSASVEDGGATKWTTMVDGDSSDDTAHCIVCHRLFASTEQRNEHLGGDICQWTARFRKLPFPESPEAVDKLRAENATERLAHLKESDERFINMGILYYAQQQGLAIPTIHLGLRRSPAPPSGSGTPTPLAASTEWRYLSAPGNPDLDELLRSMNPGLELKQQALDCLADYYSTPTDKTCDVWEIPQEVESPEVRAILREWTHMSFEEWATSLA
ncbi:unnamed protein product [Mycena citricolor]|uniref:Uncharacterized protein n=2 Tax=Mycena citricolor TaxID=2018698 RepID=A0AAD2Q5S7_9AGAR|nr:unnamed protein product [Mycena citricolor]